MCVSSRVIQLEAPSPLSLIDKYIHAKYSNCILCMVDDKTLADGVSIRKKEIRYIHNKHTRKRDRRQKKLLKRSTSIVDDGNDETCVRRARVYPLSIY